MKHDTNPSHQQGALYGIGVGPGDPDLIPVKAVKILQTVDVIFTASSTKNEHSLAVRVAAPHLPQGIPVHNLPFPMSRDRETVRAAWEENAGRVLGHLNQGQSAAFLTMGDPLTYSTFSYLLRTLHNLDPQVSITTIPGITSYQAAAAATNTPLVEGEENLLLLSGVKGGNGIRHSSAMQADTVVFLKAYKKCAHIVHSLEECGRLHSSLGVVRCSFPDQEVVRDLSQLAQKAPKYWTLILSRKKDPYAVED
ncbi:precorrin-2 C(20)-methyltransferase [Desulfovermiculus halophilus]|jgi:precorrin-2/cobalt-factor-2 C20-methyltransferase|uniref:precorrin-2 C(20)-methyltransferase n=1 Tax=Desulfovermiculus halophilus TaxID=339722 RepID=UPI000485BD2A|nr:precorrin-2 C(20)-methyltransferase [Desulfovermiculus halophilus]